MSKSRISWTEFSWNPLKVKSGGYGCTKVSPGCAHCYASAMNKRFGGLEYDYHRKPTDFYLDEKVLEEPLRRKKPTIYFVCSMCDLCHENVPDELIFKVFKAMAYSPKHTFQVLSKRPDRMRSIIPRIRSMYVDRLEHVWLGVTAENQEMADERIPILLSIPAAKRFVSVEPMLGPVNLRFPGALNPKKPENWNKLSEEQKVKVSERIARSVYMAQCETLDWVTCGGESGPGARPMHPDWVRSLRDQCVAADVPFFFKQWGDWVGWDIPQSASLVDRLLYRTASNHMVGNLHRLPKLIIDDFQYARVGKKAAGNLLDGRKWEQRPGEGS